MSPLQAGVYDAHIGVLRAGHKWWTDDERWSAVMGMVYGDVSGDDSAILTAGCYLGQEPQWLAAIVTWKKVLDDAGVDEFHATDFYSARGAFDDDRWRRRRADGEMVPGGPLHDEFAKRFCAVATDHGLIGFAFAMDAPSFREILVPLLLKEQREHRATDETTWTIMSSLAGVGRFLSDAGHREEARIQVIWEHEHGAGRFENFFKESRARQERWTHWFQSFTTADKSFYPVQIADLLAHEAWRRINHLRHEPQRKLRKSFERMLVGEKIAVHWHGREDAERNAQRYREMLAKHPNGLVPNE